MVHHHTVFLLVLLRSLALIILAEFCTVTSGNFSQLTVDFQLHVVLALGPLPLKPIHVTPRWYPEATRHLIS